jgi:hypothetical protein
MTRRASSGDRYFRVERTLKARTFGSSPAARLLRITLISRICADLEQSRAAIIREIARYTELPNTSCDVFGELISNLHEKGMLG